MRIAALILGILGGTIGLFGAGAAAFIGGVNLPFMGSVTILGFSWDRGLLAILPAARSGWIKLTSADAQNKIRLA